MTAAPGGASSLGGVRQPQRILITGASGCVGQHIAAQLFRETDAELLLWLRDPAKLTAVPATDPRITLLVGDLRDVAPHRELIATASRLIHTATAWGDPERARQVNVVAVKELLAATDPEVLEQVIYFSTASILDRDLKLLPEATAYGTEYIQTKAQCLRQLEQHPLAERIVAVFPTLVFGGGSMAAAPTPPATSPPGCGTPPAGCGWPSGCEPMPPSITSTPPILPGCACTWPPSRTGPTPSRARGPCVGWYWASRR